MGVLLVGSSQAATAAAALALEQALPRECRSCLLVFKVRVERASIHSESQDVKFKGLCQASSYEGYCG